MMKESEVREQTSDGSRNRKIFGSPFFFSFLFEKHYAQVACVHARDSCRRSHGSNSIPIDFLLRIDVDFTIAASNLHDSRRVIDREGKKKVTINFIFYCRQIHRPFLEGTVGREL